MKARVYKRELQDSFDDLEKKFSGKKHSSSKDDDVSKNGWSFKLFDGLKDYKNYKK